MQPIATALKVRRFDSSTAAMLRRRLAWMIGLVALVLPGLGMARPPATAGFDLYSHHRWTLEDGAPPDIWAITQAPDGFLWLGSGAGLYRFDGVHFERFSPLPGEALLGTNIVSLLETRSGDLWIGYYDGGATLLRKGHVRNFDDVGTGQGALSDFVEARDGSVWAAVQNDTGTGGLSRFDGDRWHALPASSGFPSGSAPDIALDRDDTLWAATAHGVVFRRRGAQRFVLSGEHLDGPSHLFADPKGGVWTADGRGGAHFISAFARSSQMTLSHKAPPTADVISTDNLFFDRSGAMWGDMRSGGLFQISDPDVYRTGRAIPLSAIRSTFTTTDGLSANHVRPFFQDREGTIWVGTNGGLDRFKRSSITKAHALDWTFGSPALADIGEDGRVYATLSDAVYRLTSPGQIEKISEGVGKANKICVGQGGRIWVVELDRSLALVHGKHVAKIAPLPGYQAKIITCARSPDGRVWLSADDGDLLRQTSASSSLFEPVRTLRNPAYMMAFQPSGMLWLVDRSGRLSSIRDGVMRRYTRRDGLTIGKIQIVLGTAPDVFVGGDLGLARYAGGRFESLRSESHPSLGRVTGLVRTPLYTWTFGITALSRIRNTDLDDAFRHPEKFLKARIFDSRDGMPGSAIQDWASNTLMQGKDPFLWLFTSNGVGWLDPDQLIQNPVPPPVTIRAITAGGQEYPFPHMVVLPKGVKDVQIDYAAVGLAVPGRVHVLYRLIGGDEHWSDPGPRRQAFFTNLDPGTYTFEVIAANDSGVWNRSGASTTFAITPTFTQTMLFKAVIVSLFLMLGLLIYGFRLRRMKQTMEIRLEERVNERERIARELHDTLLQSFQGLMFMFQATADQLPKGSQEQRTLVEAVDNAESLVAEGRTSLTKYRTIIPPISLRQSLAGFARRHIGGSPTIFGLIERGEIRQLVPLVYHETMRIGEEAIFNALRHGKPGRIDVEMIYGLRRFVMTIRDDGTGIAPSILRQGGKEDHFGLPGMHERARRMNGRLQVSSEVDRGTEVLLSVPARIAYGRTGSSHARALWRIFSRRRSRRR